MLIRSVLKIFESWIDPFEPRADLTPPGSLWAFVWFYISPARWPFFAMLLLGGMVAMLEAGLFYFVGRLVDMLGTVSPGGGWQGLIALHGTELGFMLAVVVLVRFLAVTVGALVEEQTVILGYYTMSRWQAYAHVARQSVGFFQNDFSGRIVTKVLAAGQATGDLMVALLQNVWFIVIYTASTIFLFAQVDWRLAAIVMVWVLGFLAISRFFVPRIRRLSRGSAEANSALTGRIVDAYANIQTLKLFGREEDNDNYVKAGFQKVHDAVKHFARHITGVRASLALLSGIMIAAVAAYSVDLWFSGAITAGGVAVTLGLVLRLNMLLSRMMTHFNSVMRNIGTIQNAAEMLSEPIRLQDRPDAHVIRPESTEIRFEDVTFHYGRGKGVIEGLNLVIRPGEKVGIVGRSGAGKSTLVNLLLRFHDVEGGRILLGGEDIAAVTQTSLRAQIGMVTQDTALLNRSIRDNILLGLPDATEEQLNRAIRLAEADLFIAGLQDQNGRKGLDAHVGERGVKLSGGQRQRIAIARVLLKDAPILVLDEATSALDSEVEAAIQANLDRLMEGKTVLAIAHRLSTIAALDRLVVMDRGRIIEQGSHSELIAAGGLYAELWARQSGGFIAVDEAAE
ncbi:ABC transporter ATP-binding protein [Gellertiella hungarica]|uniref:ATP-binding cassette subfamily B multidrug efflux pump n=1 Tax=Gellertiella hungarica TaxID=1572859 RepID=A0A7W6J277_9HYPH|nr:ABC transporter ATP-binding protein [Gellertiella hungarica]MBB4063387.1 ATP-binding cassette subfamily B multidrug efflux pump [Gellertiella hungarica]